jgi:hypothetical protein
VRRLLFAVLATIAAAALAACGSSSPSKPAAPSPTEQALSYLPAGSPLVLTVITDPNSRFVKGAQTTLHNIPDAALGETALFSRLSQLGIDYDKDIRPLFGNPIALGFVGTTLTGSSPPFVVSWVTRSATALAALVDKFRIGLHPAGTHDGATLYTAGGAALAVSGPTLLFSRSTQDLDAALDRHADHQGYTAAQYAQATTGIGQTGLIQVFGDLTGVLSTPAAAQARQVPWVAAIKGYGASIDATQNSLTIHYHIDTSGRSLSTSKLPIASGSAPPELAGGLPVLAGVRDPAQTIGFIEAAQRLTQPKSYASFLARQAKLKRQTGFDYNALVSNLTGDLSVESNTRTTLARAQVSSPSAVSAMLAKLPKAPTSAFTKGSRISSLGGGLYSVREPKATLTVGLIGDELAIGRATPAQLRAYAKAPGTPATGATGSAAFRIGLSDLLKITLKHAPSMVEQAVIDRLGALTGSASATTAGLTGVATMGVKGTG